MSDIITLVIADDEPIVRKRFSKAFSLEKYNYHILGEANDGQKALDLCRALKPDILITDIMMPEIDGIELTKILKEEMPDIKVIILTCHDDFKYARQAIGLGAFDYLLKVTTGKKEILEILDKARIDIVEQRHFNEIHHQSIDYIHKNVYLLRTQTIKDILLISDITLRDINEKISFLNMSPFFNNMYYMRFELNIDNQKKLPKDLQAIYFNLLESAERVFKRKYNANAVRGNKNNYYFLINNSNLESIKEFYDCLKDYWFEEYGYTFKASVSEAHFFNDVKSLKRTLESCPYEADEAMNNYFYSYTNSLLVYSSNSSKPYSPWREYVEESLNESFFSLNHFDDIAVNQNKIKKSIISRLIMNKFNPEDILIWLKELTKTVLGSKEVYDILIKKNEDYINLDNIDNISDVEKYLCNLIQTLKTKESLIDLNKNKIRPEVLKALDIVKHNYREQLSVSIICNQLNMSANYFSSTFKKEIGISFTSYLAKYRIEQSKILLSKTTLNLQQIANKVGYYDEKYYIKTFKKITGQTPGNFRRI